MKYLKIYIIATLLGLGISHVYAEDLTFRNASVVSRPLPVNWTGFYAGLNAGYGFGANNNIVGTNYGSYQTFIDASFMDPAIASALSGSMKNTQGGFIGGAQFGYNYQVNSNYVIGVETDIQGANIAGSSYGRGMGSSTMSDSYGFLTGTAGGTVAGTQSVTAGINYLGTVRGRLGYLVVPSLLVYGVAGFSYGGAYAKVNNYAIDSGTATGSAGGVVFGTAAINQTYYGNNNQSQLLLGWNAGGGLEWMFFPNWSLKGEAEYWNLGNMNIATNNWAVSALPSVSALGETHPMLSNALSPSNTKVNYQGIIAKVGVNYHFDWAAAPVVAVH